MAEAAQAAAAAAEALDAASDAIGDAAATAAANEAAVEAAEARQEAAEEAAEQIAEAALEAERMRTLTTFQQEVATWRDQLLNDLTQLRQLVETLAMEQKTMNDKLNSPPAVTVKVEEPLTSPPQSENKEAVTVTVEAAMAEGESAAPIVAAAPRKTRNFL